MLDGTPHFIAPHIEPWQVRPKLHIWAREVRTNMLRAIPSDAYRRAVVSDRIGPVRWHFLGRPEAYEHVFRTALDNYPKAPIMHRMLGPYLGKGIFLAPPEDWHWQRRALAPAFGGGGLRRMAPAMLRVATDTADRLRSEGADGRAVKISFEMRVTAMEMVRHAMLDGLAEEAKELAGHDVPDVDGLHAYRAAAQPNLDRYLEDFGRPTLPDLLNLPNWLRPARFWRRAPTDGPREMLARLVAARRSAAKTGDDLLGLMLEARDPETGRTMTDAEIRDNLMTFIVTGSDTTALALTWSIYGLTQMPQWAAKLREEADAAFKQCTEPARLTGQLMWTRRFIDETLRLFPSAPIVIRRAQNPDQICGTQVKSGDLVVAPIYALHRNPDFWPGPHRFDPERFDGNVRQERFSYLPFGAGARSCIGAGFALAEAVLTLATLVRALDFRLEEGWTVKPLMMLTLKPDGGLPVHVTARN